ncbi:MAG: glycogen debranching protein GlgX [Nitrospirae bacterium]|nr:glycogen debranching protein GlgX [Nitrospirota bacterium]
MSDHLAHWTGKKTSPGKCHPLGATLTPDGVNFTLFSQHARQVYLLLFDKLDSHPTDIIRIEHRDRFIWHVLVHDIAPGQLYGFKVQGDFDPAMGARFNEYKLLMDPYARAVTGKFRNMDNLLLPYDVQSPARDLSLDQRDNASVVPKSIVIDERFFWQGDVPPDIPLEQMIIYEVHVKGFTAHPSSRAQYPGTYLGFIEKIPHLKQLGVNAVELLPIHEFVVDDFLLQKGLTNYWGYNTIGFFAPESSYGTNQTPGCQVAEFKTLVRDLHKAGIEVILDVVFNHTAEGNEFGPVISFRGIDNPNYYLLTGTAQEPYRYYMNYTGCGNSVNLASPPTIRFVMDCLRYWVEQMHVDGFRFDLASVLGREAGAFQSSASFFEAIAQDPVLARVKLIAEPWDLGTYQVGNFPVDWSEWNGRFRDTMRKFGKGDNGQLREMGWRMTGSADLYGDDGRSPYNSINFITCHDGFTLADLVSYNGKHNDANGEHNQDGSNDNHSWNCGAEGESTDPGVIALRKQLAKNHICALLFASGTPMLLGGDEFLRTQRGNNNAYCQDNEISWFDWKEATRNNDMVEFVRKAIAFTRRCPVLQRRKFYAGIDGDGNKIPDLQWFGNDLDHPAWDDPESRTLCYQLDGNEAGGDYLLFLILHADHRLQPVRIPASPGEKTWYRVIDTSLSAGDDFREEGAEVLLDPQDHYLVNPRSTVVLITR